MTGAHVHAPFANGQFTALLDFEPAQTATDHLRMANGDGGTNTQSLRHRNGIDQREE